MGPPKFYTRKSLTRNSFHHCCLMRMRIKHKNEQFLVSDVHVLLLYLKNVYLVRKTFLETNLREELKYASRQSFLYIEFFLLEICETCSKPRFSLYR